MPKNIKIAITIVITLLILSTITGWFTSGKNLFNKCKQLEFKLRKIEKDQIATWDAHYLNFVDQKENTNISKEAFLQVTNIIMSNRKDGENLSWKWTQENTNIPFEEFTHFYKQLSSFISQRYSENLVIEREKLNVVEEQNLILNTFPNNLFNNFLKIELLSYTEGFISEETKNKFGKMK